MKTLRVTLVQADLAWRDPAANRRRLEGAVSGLDQQTDLVLLPGEPNRTKAYVEAVVTVSLDREALCHYRAGLPFLQDADAIRIGD